MSATLRTIPTTPDDGGCYIPREVLERLGNGDVKRGRRELRLLLADLQEPKTINGPTEKPATVRVATEADEPALLELLLVDLAENAKHIAPPNHERILETVRVGTRHQLGIVGVVDGPDGKPVAACCLIPVQWWWSQARYVQEVFLFVHPEHRQSHHAVNLLQFEKWVVDAWSEGFGYRVFLLAGVTATSKVEEKVRLYRRFMNPVGQFFCYPNVVLGELR